MTGSELLILVIPAALAVLLLALLSLEHLLLLTLFLTPLSLQLSYITGAQASTCLFLQNQSWPWC